MDSGLAGRAVLVTGASGGIGQAICRLLAGEGARIGAHYHTNRDGVMALSSEFGEAIVPLQADLRDEGQADAMFARAADALGEISGCVANAASRFDSPCPLHEMSLARWRGTMDAALASVFLTARGFLHHLAAVPRDEASLVLIGSTAAVFGEADYTDYASAKAALAYGMTRSLKNEIVRLAPRGRVNCVCPGWTRTPMAREATSDPAVLERVCATIPMNKIATPEDVAGAVVYLVSDRLAGHVSGEVVTVAGGMEGRRLR
jgi:3-oxoacyl-[acyl-carrier protein] reductase